VTVAGSPELLPEPVAAPLPADEALAHLRGARRRLAAQALDERTVYYRVRSRTVADIGGWLGPRPVDVFATDRGLTLVSAGRFDFEGRDPLVEHVPYDDLDRSTYNYATGRLALAPAEQCPVKRLSMGPDEAQQLLAQVHRHWGLQPAP